MSKMTIISNIINNNNHCPECHGNILSIGCTGEIACNHCGLVMDERDYVISHSETRSYTREQRNNKERVGIPISPLVPDLSLITTINRKDIQNENLRRAIKLNSHLSWEKQNLLNAVFELKRLRHNLNLPLLVAEEALKLYKQAFKLNIIKGRSINGMIAACVYYVCRIKRIPRTLKDLLDETKTTEKRFKRCYVVLKKELKLKTPVLSPVALIPRYISELQLSFEIEKLTINILESYLKNNSLRGINPKGICAGAIYLAAKFKKVKNNQKQISDVIGITDNTLRARYKELLNKINLHVLQ